MPDGDYQALLLDVDGVLIDTDDAVLNLWAAVCERFGRQRPTSADREHIVGCSVEHTVGWLFPGSDDAERAAVREFVAEMEPGLGHELLPGAADFLAALARNDVPVALVTGASKGRLDGVVGDFGAAVSVGATVTWGEVPGKPSPGPYLLAAQRLGVSPRRCIVVEDSPAGARSASSAGCLCIGLAPAGTEAAEALREGGAHRVTGSVRDITVAYGPVSGGLSSAALSGDQRVALVVDGERYSLTATRSMNEATSQSDV